MLPAIVVDMRAYTYLCFTFQGAHSRSGSESQPGHRAQQREPHSQLVRGGHSDFPPGQTRSTSSQKGQPTGQTGSSLGQTRQPTSKTAESPSQKGPPLDQTRMVARSQKDPVSREDTRVSVRPGEQTPR